MQMIMLLSVLNSVMPLNIRYHRLMQSQLIAKFQNIFESFLGSISLCTHKYRVLHKLNIFIWIYLKCQLAISLLQTNLCLHVTLITCDQLIYTYSSQLEMLVSQTYNNFNTTFYDIFYNILCWRCCLDQYLLQCIRSKPNSSAQEKRQFPFSVNCSFLFFIKWRSTARQQYYNHAAVKRFITKEI